MAEPVRGLLPDESAIAAVRASGRTHRARLADLLIVSTAAANALPLYTRNPCDFTDLDDLVIVKVV